MHNYKAHGVSVRASGLYFSKISYLRSYLNRDCTPFTGSNNIAPCPIQF